MRREVFKISLTILLLTLTVFVSASYAGKIKTIAVLPFKIHAARDLTFLKEGIMDMLSSRLSWKDRVTVIEKGLVKEKVAELKGSLNKETAFKIGKALKADYIILGSLTVFGDSVSIDAKILDVAKEEELITAFNQSKGMDEVIPTVNKFAQDINAKIMGRHVSPPVYAKAPEEHKGPKALIKEKDFFIEEKIAHIFNYRTQIIGLDVADVDGDGKNEVVFIDERTLYIYKLEGRKLVEFIKFGGSFRNKYLWLDVADTDNDGKAEIYVTNTFGEGLDSFALKWQNRQLVTLAKGQNWFFRVINLPDKGETLIGQKREMSAGFSPGIYILNHEGKGFRKGEKLDLPRWANALNFTIGDITGQGKGEFILLSSAEKLELYDSDRDEIWESDENYGGKPTSLNNTSGPDIVSRERIFLPSRILLTDIDGDGRNEVVVCKNKQTARILAEMRFFTSGRIEFLRWRGTDMATFIKTGQMSKYISDYQVADVDNDGEPELIVSAVKDYSAIKGKGNRSQIVIYELK